MIWTDVFCSSIPGYLSLKSNLSSAINYIFPRILTLVINYIISMHVQLPLNISVRWRSCCYTPVIISACTKDVFSNNFRSTYVYVILYEGSFWSMLMMTFWYWLFIFWIMIGLSSVVPTSSVMTTPSPGRMLFFFWSFITLLYCNLGNIFCYK